MLVGYHLGIPIGLLRMDFSEDRAILSYNIARESRGRGYGKELIRAGESWIMEKISQVRILEANVKSENIPSRRLLKENGFTESEVKGVVCYTKRIR